MKKGFTLIELLIVVAIIAILAAIAVPNFLEAQVRAKVSRAKNDQRSLATGIETYYVDNNQYPVYWRNGLSKAGTATSGIVRPDSTLANASPGIAQNYIPSFGVSNTSSVNFATLTTPIAYITSYFSDPFADTRQATFGYYCDTNGWILWSPGPDTDESNYTQLGAGFAVETIYTSQVSQPSPTLIAAANSATGNAKAFTYDPTNGTVSSGDVWRVKQ